ncbi:DUF3300 domain-containing protein [Marinimicrobium sp. ARAG 43.8]|uniref:DUF3300 domain-containing protein n=1 Tax=Marinimicrobium sp. ARAG 43.8 TaxID=3418719 RepID=UPI003CF5C5DC
MNVYSERQGGLREPHSSSTRNTFLLVLAALALLWITDTRAEDRIYQTPELEQWLAPIALYPDSVLSHVLIASTYPLEVVQAHRWSERHPQREGAEAVAAVDNEDWDPSVKALVAFPDLLARMSDDLDWLEQLGEAFLDDEAAVLAAVQDLRQRAYHEGHLQSTDHQSVIVESNTIIVEPRVSTVVYLPYYDTRTAYGAWRWQRHPPKAWHHPRRGYWHSGVFWSFGTHIDQRQFYFSGFRWHDRATLVVNLGHRHPAFHSGRSVVSYREAQHWKHNPRYQQRTHRQGKHRQSVIYRQRPNHPTHNRQRHGNRHYVTPSSPPTIKHAPSTRQANEHPAHRHQVHPPDAPSNQQSFQRSTRDRVEAARNRPSITDRARQRR